MQAEAAADVAISDGDRTPPVNETGPAPEAAERAQLRRDALIVAATALVVSLLSAIYLYHHGMTNLYLDGIAHVNIARKVVDSSENSLWRQYLQIGSPWLPVHTVLMLPLVANDFMWRSGLAGSLISMAAFVVAAVAVYLLASNFYANREKGRRLPALFTAGIFVFNPAIMYMQATPMTESLFIAVLAVGVLLLYGWSRNQRAGRLIAAAILFAAATLTRYEAWPVAALSVALIAAYSHRPGDRKPNRYARSLIGWKLKNTALYSIIVLIGPAYWLWHNWAIFGNPFEFLTGPYSARGLYSQNQATLGWATIFMGHPLLDLVLMLIAVAACVGPLTILLAAGGLASLVAKRRTGILRDGMLVLLVVPFVFHVISLCRGEIQVFPISAFGLLNVRYGLPALLPVALLVPGLLSSLPPGRFWLQVLLLSAVVVFQYGWLLSSGPSGLDVYQEAYRNGVNSKTARELSRSSAYLSGNHVQPMVLMHTGALGPLISRGGLNFSQVIHEGTARWHAFTHQIPHDVSTVIILDGDLLDARFRSDSDLERDLRENFREVYHQGRIHIHERKNP